MRTYDLRPFDSKALKLSAGLGRVVLAYACFNLVIGSLIFYYMHNKLPLQALCGFWLIWSPVALYFVTAIFTPSGMFTAKNKLKSFFEGPRNTWKFVGPQYHAMLASSFLKKKHVGMYGERLVALPLEDAEIPLAFVGNTGCVAWIALERSFPHMVVDSLTDRAVLWKYFQKNKLPTEQLILEGDFPSYFKVYHEPGQQLLTLQILTPDRMRFLVDNLHYINLEIQGSYLRLYAAEAQKNSQAFSQFLEALQNFQRGLKTARLDTITD